jgi:exodeoxyribonuclease VII small subunit
MAYKFEVEHTDESGVDSVSVEAMSFEEAFAKLEATVRQLEAGDLSIEEAVCLYEQGTELARLCQQRLDSVELRVSRLAPLAQGGFNVVPIESGW